MLSCDFSRLLSEFLSFISMSVKMLIFFLRRPLFFTLSKNGGSDRPAIFSTSNLSMDFVLQEASHLSDFTSNASPPPPCSCFTVDRLSCHHRSLAKLEIHLCTSQQTHDKGDRPQHLHVSFLRYRRVVSFFQSQDDLIERSLLLVTIVADRNTFISLCRSAVCLSVCPQHRACPSRPLRSSLSSLNSL
jgi:hypothetical protein